MNYTSTDIWTTQAEAIVIPVNCVGIMGKGLALQCKLRHLTVFEVYKSMCEDGAIQVGESCAISTEEKSLILCPTKIHWKQPSVFGHVRKSFESIIYNNAFWRFESIAVPKLGCGEGKLMWEEYKNGLLCEYCIRSLFESFEELFPCDMYFHV